MRECGKYEYLMESKEFKIFTRSAGETDSALDTLDRQAPIQILEKYRLNFPTLNEEQEESEVVRYR